MAMLSMVEGLAALTLVQEMLVAPSMVGAAVAQGVGLVAMDTLGVLGVNILKVVAGQEGQRSGVPQAMPEMVHPEIMAVVMEAVEVEVCKTARQEGSAGKVVNQAEVAQAVGHLLLVQVEQPGMVGKAQSESFHGEE